jgi:beta-fructofuranosidase
MRRLHLVMERRRRPGNSSGLFSGNQTSGNDNIIAYYTSWEPDRESQHLAWPYDGGLTFNQYEQNPIISLDRHEFCDPKISFHHEIKTWVMVLSCETEVAFYTSTDLVKWTQSSLWSPQRNIDLIERPQFLQIPCKDKSGSVIDVKWFRMLSLGGGGPDGVTVVSYLTGEWDGTTFTPDAPSGRRTVGRSSIQARQDSRFPLYGLESGPGNYAMAFFHSQSLERCHPGRLLHHLGRRREPLRVLHIDRPGGLVSLHGRRAQSLA